MERDHGSETADLRGIRAALSADGQRVLTSRNGELVVWDATTRQQLQTPSDGISDVHLTLSRDGRRAIGTYTPAQLVPSEQVQGWAIMWDATTGGNPWVFEKSATELSKLATTLSADGRFVLAGYDGRTAIVQDAVTRQKLRTFEGLACALSADGQRVLTEGQDNTAMLWDATTGQKLRTFEGHARAKC